MTSAAPATSSRSTLGRRTVATAKAATKPRTIVISTASQAVSQRGSSRFSASQVNTTVPATTAAIGQRAQRRRGFCAQSAR
ncbi:hypothetical protein D9M68_746280 [compost metagenome]